jgi:very-short-patch-repair endonuclease
MAAVIACGQRSALSHTSAAALWRIRPAQPGAGVHVTVPGDVARKVNGIKVHRRTHIGGKDITRRHSVPVTTPLCTIVDLASTLERGPLERVINQADTLNLITPDRLRAGLEKMGARPGLSHLRRTLDRRRFRLTRSELERIFLPLVKRVGLPLPLTKLCVNNFEVDFFWPDLGLVIETDGLTYHRTPAQQAADRIRDQTHTAAGMTPLRFTHEQIAFEGDYVEGIVRAVAARLGRARA